MTRFLLDTHVLIWWAEAAPRIGPVTRKALKRPNALVSMSVVSAWEIAIKLSRGRIKLRRPLGEIIDGLLADDCRCLPVQLEHALAAGQLPPIHEDPFDRMLVAQAQCEDMTVVTVDPAIEAYGIRTLDASE